MSAPVLLLLVVIAACLVVATILGWIAVSQIRRSQGSLCGLGLAVFDGLLLPLLLLDGLIVALGTTLSKMFVAFFANPALQNRPEVDPALATKIANTLAGYAAVSFLVIALIVIVVDYLIIRAVWRAVNKSTAPQMPEVPIVGSAAPADFQSLETTSAVLMTPEELERTGVLKVERDDPSNFQTVYEVLASVTKDKAVVVTRVRPMANRRPACRRAPS